MKGIYPKRYIAFFKIDRDGAVSCRSPKRMVSELDDDDVQLVLVDGLFIGIQHKGILDHYGIFCTGSGRSLASCIGVTRTCAGALRLTSLPMKYSCYGWAVAARAKQVIPVTL